MEITMRTIGENIRYYRKRAGLTLKELEEEIGTHYSNICRWEKNSQTPSIMSLLSLCDALNVTPNELLNCEEGEKKWQNK